METAACVPIKSGFPAPAELIMAALTYLCDADHFQWHLGSVWDCQNVSLLQIFLNAIAQTLVGCTSSRTCFSREHEGGANNPQQTLGQPHSWEEEHPPAKITGCVQTLAQVQTGKRKRWNR
eukprot:585405-Amphidinium_carterae.1